MHSGSPTGNSVGLSTAEDGTHCSAFQQPWRPTQVCVLTLVTSIKTLTIAYRNMHWLESFPRLGHLPLHSVKQVGNCSISGLTWGSKKVCEGEDVLLPSGRAGVVADSTLFCLCLCAIVLNCHSKKHCYQRSRYSAACTTSTGSDSLLGRQVSFRLPPLQSQGI